MMTKNLLAILILTLLGTGCASMTLPSNPVWHATADELRLASDSDLVDSASMQYRAHRYRYGVEAETVPAPLMAELVRRGIVRSENAEMVASRHFMIGFSDAETVVAVGRPDSINRSVSGSGSHAQWVYTSFQTTSFTAGGDVHSYSRRRPSLYIYMVGNCGNMSPLHPRNPGVPFRPGCNVRSWQD